MPREDLEGLRRRWELERSPQLALQVAEEYRRAGQPERALEVLREDLAAHPNHTSSRVALGRYLLDAGSAGEAAEALEDVVAIDPTHLVANKLLVRTYTRLGDGKRAIDRLDLYALLNESDPEIEELRLAVEATAAAAPAEGELEEPAPASAPVGSAPEVAAETGPAVPEAVAAEPAPAGAATDPFPGLWDGLDRERWRAAIAAEGLFAVADRIPPAAEAVPAGPPAALEPPAEPATVTLAELYLEQGHRTEAERIFRAVLEREPENEAARRGLRRLGAAAGGLTAAELLRGRGLDDGADPRQRRKALLESYLERIRRGGE